MASFQPESQSLRARRRAPLPQAPPSRARGARLGAPFARLTRVFRGLGVLLAAAGVLAAGLWGLRTLVYLGPLKVHGIEVRGLTRTPRDALLEAAHLELGQPLLLVNLPAAVAAIEALPWVRQATVRRQLPDRLRIEVVEHRAKAAAMIGELWLINPEGEPFKRFAAADGLALPVMTGIRAQPVADRPLQAQQDVMDRLREGLVLLDALVDVRDDLFNVDELHFDGDLGWSSVLLLGRAHARAGAPRPAALVHLGPEPALRLPVLVHALEQLADRHEVPTVIWASQPHQEGRIQVQLAAVAAAAANLPAPSKRASKPTKRPATALPPRLR